MGRLTDVDELVEYLQYVTVTDGITFETGFKQILNDIKNAPTIEPKQEWIDLQERRPEMEKLGSVWISETILAAHHGYVICFGYFKKTKEDGEIVFVGYDDDFDEHRDEYPEDLVMTHWMPLPKLPEKE